MGMRHATNRRRQLIPRACLILCFGLFSPGCGFCATADSPRTFLAHGTIEQIQPESRRLIIQHDAISNYMDAMTMPFKVKDVAEMNGLEKGDVVSFRLQVNSSESWIDQIQKVGTSGEQIPVGAQITSSVNASNQPSDKKRHPLMDYKFTNELGQAVSIADFRGQALAITFFFTR